MRRRLQLAIVFLAVAATSSAQQISDFAGTWVLRYQGQPILKLTLSVERGRITGSLTQPKELDTDQDGDVTKIGGPAVVEPVAKTRLARGRLELTVGDRFTMTLEGRDRASLELVPDRGSVHLRPWSLERASGDVMIVTSLPERQYPPEIRALQEQLRGMIQEDQDARAAFDTARADRADAKNRPEVLRIFDRYGWLTRSQAGKEASHNFWLLVQHQTLEIQQRLLPAMEKAATAGEASMSDYAYLYDRVHMGLGKPQHWGSQARCEKGKPVLYSVDDQAGLEARRRELFLPPIGEYLRSDYLVKFCAAGARSK